MDLLERALLLESHIKKCITTENIKHYAPIWQEVNSICTDLLSIYETKHADKCIEVLKVLARIEEPERVISEKKKGTVFTDGYPSQDYYLYHHSEKIRNCIRLIASPTNIRAPQEHINMEKAGHDLAIKFLTK
ncbi:hypothetical protein GR140_18750 [Pseudomonas putida]|uniref:hypothetical protein n=1 Tax=Pseudomonas putida TaxID=303 RepID=UPI001BB0BEE3|nr:hypothetical protein [Pseudomonas putida]QUG90704.1 hypothetical protein GR140_18750 [Pseudomonas putida]